MEPTKEVKPNTIQFYLASDFDLQEMDVQWSFTFGDAELTIVRASDVADDIDSSDWVVPTQLAEVIKENPDALIAFEG